MSKILKQFLWASTIGLIATGMTGCVKSSSPVTVSPVSYVSVMNEAPYGVPVDIYFNGTLVSPTGGIAPGRYSSAYGSLKPGSYTVAFKKAGTDSIVYQLPASNYDTSAFYTLILYNVNADSTAMQAAKIEDDFSQVTTSEAYYRFFNLSPDAPSANLSFNNQLAQNNRTPADNILTNTAYDTFLPLAGGTYTIQVQNAATDSLLASSPQLALHSGDVYTIFLSGTIKSGLSLNVLQAVY